MLTLILALFTSATPWTQLPSTGFPILSTLHAFGDTLLACGNGGCTSTSNGGQTWTPHRVAGVMGMAPVFSGHVGISRDGISIHLTRDGGRTWTPWMDGIGSGTSIARVDLVGDLAFASAFGQDYLQGQSASPQTCSWYVRRIEETSWKRIDTRETNNDLCYGISIGAGGRLFRTVDTLMPDNVYPDALPQTSFDGGATWESGDTNATVARITGSRSIFLRRSSSGGDLSFDSGRTWSMALTSGSQPVVLDGAISLGDSLPWRTLGSEAERTILTDSLSKYRYSIKGWARTGNRLWGIGSYGLVSSDDSGRSWSTSWIGLPLEGGTRLQWHAGMLYGIRGAHKYTRALFRSPDQGITWTRLSPWYSSMNFAPKCGPDLQIPYEYAYDAYGSTRRDTIRISALGVSNTVTSFTCPADLRWDSIAFVDSSTTNNPPANKRIVKLPYRYGIGSKAFVDGGIFVTMGRSTSDGPPEVAFIADGSDSARTIWALEGGRATLWETPKGALLACNRGLFLCTADSGCQPSFSTGADSLWSFGGFRESGNGSLFLYAIQHDRNFRPDYSRIKLFASPDSGRNWTGFDVPGILYDATLTPSGIIASTDGAGLWLLPSDTFRLTGISPARNARSTGPSLLAHGRILSLSGMLPGVRLRVFDPSGRILLDLRPEVRDGRATAMVPPSAPGVLFAELTGPGMRSGFRWIHTER